MASVRTIAEQEENKGYLRNVITAENAAEIAVANAINNINGNGNGNGRNRVLPGGLGGGGGGGQVITHWVEHPRSTQHSYLGLRLFRTT